MSILYDWQHEGPDDPAADEALLEEAQQLSQEYRDQPGELRSLEEFSSELAGAEAGDELPD